MNTKNLTWNAVLAVAIGLSLAACNKETPAAGSPSDLEALKTRNAELEEAVKTLSAQVRTLNQEQNQMKQLVSDMSDSVLAQASAPQKAVEAAPKPIAPAAAVTPPKPRVVTPTRPITRTRTPSRPQVTRRTAARPAPTRARTVPVKRPAPPTQHRRR